MRRAKGRLRGARRQFRTRWSTQLINSRYFVSVLNCEGATRARRHSCKCREPYQHHVPPIKRSPRGSWRLSFGPWRHIPWPFFPCRRLPPADCRNQKAATSLLEPRFEGGKRLGQLAELTDHYEHAARIAQPIRTPKRPTLRGSTTPSPTTTPNRSWRSPLPETSGSARVRLSHPLFSGLQPSGGSFFAFDFRAHSCHSAPIETHAFGFRLWANAPEGQKRFRISGPGGREPEGDCEGG
jgi:hypothetical protein